MPITEEKFRAEIERITHAMVELADDYVETDERVQAIYLYGGMTSLVTFNVFYKVDGKFFTIADVDEALGKPRRDRRAWDATLVPGTQLTDELMNLFVDNDRETPYELRMVYDCQAESLDFRLYYDEPKAGSPMQAFDEWRRAVRAGKDPLPAEED